MRETLSRGNTMLMARYFVLLLVYHFVSFFKLMPWTFVWGLVQWPWFFMLGMLVPDDHKKQCVRIGSAAILEYEGTGKVPTMPAFIRRRFELIKQEASS